MKQCAACKKTKPFTEFHKNGTRYQGRCKPCRNLYVKGHYEANPAPYKARAKVQTAKVAKEVNDYKEALGCQDCKVGYPGYILQFDHVRGEKEFNISSGLRQHSWKKVCEEIKKCEVVCANCHAERTHQRFVAQLEERRSHKPGL